MAEVLEIGKITGRHGIRGALRVLPLTDDPVRFSELNFVYIERNGIMEKHYIKKVSFSKEHVIVKLQGIESIPDAEAYKNKYMLVKRENAVRLKENNYFICDIIGCRVYDDTKGYIGNVEDVLSTGSNDVYVVVDGKREYLVPAMKSVVREVSVSEKRINVILPEGLIEDEI